MSKTGRNILLAVLGIAALAGSIILVRRTRAEAAGTTPGGNGGSTVPGGNTGGGGVTFPGGGSTGGGTAQLDYNIILKFTSGTFSNRAEVKELQRILNAVEASNPLVVDGMFGPKTEAKLKRLNGGSGQISLAYAKIKWPYA